ncbi:tRNA pseudouridine synthase 1 [Fulvia fulva]|uniref:tRNA pseudouridine synthase 1 n=1 Tax=Passalora fulva TaxID=5499 RepID=A0A9Q8P909_PASFU|nr:tRNA pseudouridine synthase 1 [Fulvia fulva]KAK4625988.1 tRNA pseudouridine synthase 1 [Fulvia fulva]UJO17567.1 tRNA pseudouridine synthase 1 [Fulvia fulva]
MDHSTAILDDAGKKIDNAAKASSSDRNGESSRSNNDRGEKRHDKPYQSRHNQGNDRKRKGNFNDSSMHHGSRRGGRNDNKRHKKGDMGRGEYFATNPDKRRRNEEASEKRLREGAKGQGVEFSKDEIDAEERRPKRKVAVLIGYSGTGYKGMQISGTEKTIEGDLFQAFIKAGAISKANAEDPKKSSLVRCARTDKGVHAAGNMISLKLIVEDDDIVEKINEALSPQIRVWGIERTIGSFSCYQACDSRWYEYLIPSYAFLPPHPSSWLAKQIEAAADAVGDREGYEARQAEVKGFWQNVDETDIKPILETIDEDIRWDVIRALQGEEEASAKTAKPEPDDEQPEKEGKKKIKQEPKDEKTEEAAIIINDPKLSEEVKIEANAKTEPDMKVEADVKSGAQDETAPKKVVNSGIGLPEIKTEEDAVKTEVSTTEAIATAQPAADPEMERTLRLRAATKRLRNAYIQAKRRYRIPQQRIARIQDALNRYLGTRNYHNYTIQKTFKDPSAKRHIKSFQVNTTPVLIGDGPEDDKTEWLSMKVHGQSFMMHQIRKMVGMVTILVRSGGQLDQMDKSFTEARYSIPKVPGLGLLLERPVFDSYNTQQASKHDRPTLEFSKYDAKLQDFKEREIYQRIFREEEEKNEFARFFNHVDNFKESYFLFVTSKGLDATKDIERRS